MICRSVAECALTRSRICLPYSCLCCLSMTLLDHVRQLLSQQSLPAGASGVILTTAKEDILPDGEGPGLQGAAESVRLRVGMHPHRAEVCTQRLLHRAARGRGK